MLVTKVINLYVIDFIYNLNEGYFCPCEYDLVRSRVRNLGTSFSFVFFYARAFHFFTLKMWNFSH
jgi:hypothetical protein